MVFVTGFMAFLGIAAAYAAYLVRAAWRDPNNWDIDPGDKDLAFQNWSEVTFSAAFSVLCLLSMIVLLAI